MSDTPAQETLPRTKPELLAPAATGNARARRGQMARTRSISACPPSTRGCGRRILPRRFAEVDGFSARAWREGLRRVQRVDLSPTNSPPGRRRKLVLLDRAGVRCGHRAGPGPGEPGARTDVPPCPSMPRTQNDADRRPRAWPSRNGSASRGPSWLGNFRCANWRNSARREEGSRRQALRRNAEPPLGTAAATPEAQRLPLEVFCPRRALRRLFGPVA